MFEVAVLLLKWLTCLLAVKDESILPPTTPKSGTSRSIPQLFRDFFVEDSAEVCCTEERHLELALKI